MPVSILLINAQSWDSAFILIFHERKIGRKGVRKEGFAQITQRVPTTAGHQAQPFLLWMLLPSPG